MWSLMSEIQSSNLKWGCIPNSLCFSARQLECDTALTTEYNAWDRFGTSWERHGEVDLEKKKKKNRTYFEIGSAESVQLISTGPVPMVVIGRMPDCVTLSIIAYHLWPWNIACLWLSCWYFEILLAICAYSCYNLKPEYLKPGIPWENI